jgi:hypothetical protein
LPGGWRPLLCCSGAAVVRPRKDATWVALGDHRKSLGGSVGTGHERTRGFAGGDFFADGGAAWEAVAGGARTRRVHAL